jgi:hypothetical protein
MQLTDEELDIVSGGEAVLIACAIVTVMAGLFGLGSSLYSGSHNHCDKE